MFSPGQITRHTTDSSGLIRERRIRLRVLVRGRQIFVLVLCRSARKISIVRCDAEQSGSILQLATYISLRGRQENSLCFASMNPCYRGRWRVPGQLEWGINELVSNGCGFGRGVCDPFWLSKMTLQFPRHCTDISLESFLAFYSVLNGTWEKLEHLNRDAWRCDFFAEPPWMIETYQISVGKELRGNIICRYVCMSHLTLDRHILSDAFILNLLDMKTYQATVNTWVMAPYTQILCLLFSYTRMFRKRKRGVLLMTSPLVTKIRSTRPTLVAFQYIISILLTYKYTPDIISLDKIFPLYSRWQSNGNISEWQWQFEYKYLSFTYLHSNSLWQLNTYSMVSFLTINYSYTFAKRTYVRSQVCIRGRNSNPNIYRPMMALWRKLR